MRLDGRPIVGFGMDKYLKCRNDLDPSESTMNHSIFQHQANHWLSFVRTMVDGSRTICRKLLMYPGVQ